MNLSTAQSQIVNAPLGKPMQVLASAGSGKTRVLVERVRYILENTKKDGIIAMTFTNKAADEMKSRLEDVENVDKRCWIATIHAIAQRIVEQYGNTIGLPNDLNIFEREQDRKALFLESVKSSGIDFDAFLNVSADDAKVEKSRAELIKSYMENISLVKRELLTEDEIKEKFDYDGDFWTIFESYQEALINSGGIDFDDILVYAHRVLIQNPWCGDVYRTQYKHICVDEAQDLNKAQYEFVKSLCGESIKSLMLVGDPNQMIYGFNGSSHDYLCKSFVNDFVPDKYELKENYRSSKTVIRLANKLKPGSQIGTEYAFEGDSVLGSLQNEVAEAAWIFTKIQELLKLKTHAEIEGEIGLNKMVVIARNKFVFQTLEEKLKFESIPYSLKKGEQLVEPISAFGKTIDLAIRLRINPKDWVDGKKLCKAIKIKAPKNWGIDSQLQVMANEVVNSEGFYPSIQGQLLTAIQNLDLEQPNMLKFCDQFKKLIEDTHANLSEMEKSDESVEHEFEMSLKELLEFKKRWVLFKSKGLGESLLSFRNAAALGQLNEDYDPNGLTLSTVHTMKGLEKDIVFIMGMCEGVFPDYRAKINKELEEERNSAFVAVTRSRRWIYITYPKSRIMPWGDAKPQVASRFINDMKK